MLHGSCNGTTDVLLPCRSKTEGWQLGPCRRKAMGRQLRPSRAHLQLIWRSMLRPLRGWPPWCRPRQAIGHCRSSARRRSTTTTTTTSSSPTAQQGAWSAHMADQGLLTGAPLRSVAGRGRGTSYVLSCGCPALLLCLTIRCIAHEAIGRGTDQQPGRPVLGCCQTPMSLECRLHRPAGALLLLLKHSPICAGVLVEMLTVSMALR